MAHRKRSSTPEYQSKQFQLWVDDEKKQHGVKSYHLHIHDRFSGVRHRPERVVFATFVRRIEKHLAKNPHLDFQHPRNLARKIIYLPPGIRAWAQYMPGGFATYPVHNPDIKHLHSGQRVGYLTRNLFRHSQDAIGLRSRAYAMSWYVVRSFGHETRRLNWLSVAAGTGQPTYDAAMHLARRPQITLADINHETLEFAQKLARARGIHRSVKTVRADVTERGAFAELLRETRADVVDMMGLVEYLDDAIVTKLVQTFHTNAPRGSLLIFTNMRPTHPQLQTHKRGLGWPGVIVRTTEKVMRCIENAGISRDNVEIMLPDDNVYALYCIKQP